jgi:2-dehydro-3-deoxygalactonokinase
VLPGTHSKWARVEHGVVLDFTTFMTGEMYDALLGHTILGRLPADAPAVDGTAAFARGVLRGLGAGGFTHDVFGARTLMLMGELPAGDVPEWLSGFVIGREIRNARPGRSMRATTRRACWSSAATRSRRAISGRSR